MEEIRVAIEAVLEAESPCTVRQVYYQLVSRKVVEKTEAQYDTTCRLLAEMRREGRIPFSAIADNTRWMRKPRSWSSLAGALDHTRATYRRALWDEQDAYVEIWLEKDALSGVLFSVTSEWDVPLMVTRGFASLSFLHSAAEEIASQGKPTYLYYFGDHDPSGVHIDRNVERELREMAPEAEIHFRREAVLPWQIEAYGLPTRPTKRNSVLGQKFAGESVEVDSISPTALRAMAELCITQHIDPVKLGATKRVEQSEKETLRALIDGGLPARRSVRS